LIAFAVIGYFIGVAAFYLFRNLEPWIREVLPMLVSAEWVVAGLIGAVVTVILVVVWSYTSRT